MKFTEGMWRLREGIRIDWMSNVERYTIKDEKVDLLLNKLQRGRGDTLNSATISAEVTSPLEGVVGVKFVHWAGGLSQGPHFPLTTSTGHVEITPSATSLAYTSGPLTLTINTSPNDLTFTYTSPHSPTPHALTSHTFRSIGYVSDQTTPASLYSDGMFMERAGYMHFGLDLQPHEKLYGLGERFGPFIKNGQAVDMWNEDGGTSSELAYKNIPFYMSSGGYGVFVNDPGRVSFELQSERTTRVNVSLEGEEVQYFVVFGPSPKHILDRFTRLTGRPSLVPAWSYGLWLTTSFTTNYSEQTVTSFLDGFRDRDIPLSVFHFDSFWMKSYQWCDFEFDPAMFPDAGRSRTDGRVFQWDLWQAGMAIIDFTNPAACTWFQSHLHRLMSLGIHTFKTDFGERIPFKNILYHTSPLSPTKMHNYYTHLFNSLVYTTLHTPNPLTPPHLPAPAAAPEAGSSLLFSRSATVGAQKYPIHWAGDSESTFPALAEVIRGGLSLGLCGVIFHSSDIGGFEGTPSPAVYKRWVQFGLLSSHSRLHGSSSYRVPWIYDDDDEEKENSCVDVLRKCVRRKLALTPYVLGVALEGARTGVPVMRALLVEFPADEGVWGVDAGYLLGPNLLVFPVLEESGWVRFYVPRSTDTSVSGDGDEKEKGKWISWFDHSKSYEEGRWYTETHGFDTLPLLIRPRSLTLVNWKLSDPEGDPLDGLEVLVNGPVEGEVKLEVVDPARTGVVLALVTVSSGNGDGEDGVVASVRRGEKGDGELVEGAGVRVVVVGDV
ncbi:putative sugar hydrolase [Aspergillus heteromorphus CBS 117.55]|uniref:Putative sugar hydrolase n=1 Tax=Aspergillus heteromorphus CBS 117.55 TaxID=1448321 RepID=A0A317W7X5_9EURO|nr:putative sugar hydrolase [Aspergillus heteromorphus CBS 117.55]PWY82179.1 putative sugar hydrolase [Aspergillus heteromorphus CBS 117.55]